MDGKLPYFMFFMVKMMKNWIGMDYERGLAMLKEFIETGEVISRVEKTTISTILQPLISALVDIVLWMTSQRSYLIISNSLVISERIMICLQRALHLLFMTP